MQVSKEKFCKCGHNKLEHKENPNSKLSFPNECKLCKCNSYMNRKLPDKSSKFLLVLGFFTIFMFVIPMVMLVILMPDNYWEAKEVTNRSFWILLGVFLFAIIGLSTGNVINSYFQEKKRKEYPIE